MNFLYLIQYIFPYICMLTNSSGCAILSVFLWKFIYLEILHVLRNSSFIFQEAGVRIVVIGPAPNKFIQVSVHWIEYFLILFQMFTYSVLDFLFISFKRRGRSFGHKVITSSNSFLLQTFKKETGYMYTMYTDPDRELYKVLGLKSNPNYGDNAGSKTIFICWRNKN